MIALWPYVDPNLITQHVQNGEQLPNYWGVDRSEQQASAPDTPRSAAGTYWTAPRFGDERSVEEESMTSTSSSSSSGQQTAEAQSTVSVRDLGTFVVLLDKCDDARDWMARSAALLPEGQTTAPPQGDNSMST